MKRVLNGVLAGIVGASMIVLLIVVVSQVHGGAQYASLNKSRVFDNEYGTRKFSHQFIPSDSTALADTMTGSDYGLNVKVQQFVVVTPDMNDTTCDFRVYDGDSNLLYSAMDIEDDTSVTFNVQRILVGDITLQITLDEWITDDTPTIYTYIYYE